MNYQEIWKLAADFLGSQMEPEAFNLWIKPVKVLSFENGVLMLSVPNKYFSEWLKANYLQKIEELLCDKLAQKINIEFKETQDLAPILKKVEDLQEPQETNTSPEVLAHNPFNPKYTFDRFIVGGGNRFAHAACEAVAKDPGKLYNPLFIYGGVGLGKTHLLHAIGNHVKKNNPSLKILYVTSETFINEFIDSIRHERSTTFRNKYRNVDCLLIDDIQFLVGKQSSQEEFFNTFNDLHTVHKQIVITADKPPKEMPQLQERLISRFEWGVVADVQAPDLETRIAIMRAKAAEEKISIPNDVILLIATKIKSNIRELEGTLLRITAFSAFTGTPLTVDSVQKIIKDVVSPSQETAPITIEKIKKVVGKHYNLDIVDLVSKRRTASVALPRQLAMYLARTLTDQFSTTEIGESFGGRDHTTVLHACNKINTDLSKDAFFSALVNKIIQEIRERDEEE